MGIRTSLAGGLTRAARALAPGEPVEKAFGNAVPPAMEAAEERSQMTPASPFSPGTPIGPYEGYDRTPRATPFTTGYNIATRPRTHERVSFETLKGLIDAYDISQICINHRIDSLRSLDWQLVPVDHYSGDATEYIKLGMKALDKPDRVHYFETWLGKWLWDELAYGCGPLYRLRNRAGRCIGLLPVEVTSVAPLLDYWGLPPGAMEYGTIPDADLPPSHVQYVNGLPWNWLTKADLIYEPYRLHNDSPYGRAPIESIIISANTDIRFQLYFLQTFTDGNLPAAFASSPETWTPDQIEQFQAYWDGIMYGDQAKKHQIRWMPPGTKFAWSNEKEFTDTFSLFLLRKTAAAFHVVPSDLGLTETVNRSSGESQADVQHRVGDLPFIRYVSRILSSFLQDDLKLPLKFTFDLGEEQDDRAEQANADKIYVDMGAVGVSELREMRYGLTDPVPVPRYIMTGRGGPVPIASLLAVAGEVDPATGLPAVGAALPKDVFGGAEGVLPVPPIVVTPLAERLYGPDAMPPKPPPQPQLQDSGKVVQGHVAKEGEASPGITAETGLYSYDGPGERDDEDEDGYPLTAHVLSVAGDPEKISKEIAAFKRYSRARRRAGEWRDFRFDHVPAGEARQLNAEGRQAVAKGSVPGLTSCSGMISLDVPEGLIEPLPGGVTDHHVTIVFLGDLDDQAFAQACARAQAAASSAPGPLEGTISGIGAFPPSGSSDGKVPVWAAVAVPGAEDLREALADLSASEHKHWAPHCTLTYSEAGEPLPAPIAPVEVTFTHLSVHRGEQVERFPLGPGAAACCGAGCCSGGCCNGDGGCQCAPAGPSEGDESTCPCGTPVIYDEMNGWQHADGSISHDDGESVSDKMAAIAKAAVLPKAPRRGRAGSLTWPLPPTGRRRSPQPPSPR